MENFLNQIPNYVEMIALALMGLVILATIVVRLTPSKLDDASVGKITAMIVKIIAWLPTIGLNPRTKKLEDAYKELEALKK
jgi:hypothetical protein